MTFTPDKFGSDVLLSFQRALWDIVTPDLRAVATSWSKDEVTGRFVYDHPVGEDEREQSSEAETEVLADLLPPTTTHFWAEYLPPGERRELLDGESWVFLRREI